MRLPALIALRTARGASEGAIAVPSGPRAATPAVGEVGVVVVVVVSPGGPEPPVWASADAEPAPSTAAATIAGTAKCLRQLDRYLRTRPPSSACGVSCRAGAKGACAPTLGGLAPVTRVPRSRLRVDEIRR